MKNVIFDANEADAGGAIFVDLSEATIEDYALWTFSNTTFTDNKARSYGGGIYMAIRIDRVAIQIKKSTFLNNSAAIRGGADILLNTREIRS